MASISQPGQRSGSRSRRKQSSRAVSFYILQSGAKVQALLDARISEIKRAYCKLGRVTHRDGRLPGGLSACTSVFSSLVKVPQLISKEVSGTAGNRTACGTNRTGQRLGAGLCQPQSSLRRVLLYMPRTNFRQFMQVEWSTLPRYLLICLVALTVTSFTLAQTSNTWPQPHFPSSEPSTDICNTLLLRTRSFRHLAASISSQSSSKQVFRSHQAAQTFE